MNVDRRTDEAFEDVTPDVDPADHSERVITSRNAVVFQDGYIDLNGRKANELVRLLIPQIAQKDEKPTEGTKDPEHGFVLSEN